LTRGGSSRGNDERRCIKDTCMFYSLIAAIVLNLVLVATPVYAQDRFIIVASTTSARDSGLFDYLLPIFKQKTGITVMVWAQGSGDALDMARRGKADVVLVHSKSAEEKFIAEGEGVKRFPVMYNDFLLIGPKDDPAGIKGMNDAAKAFQAIKQKQACFVSRGDQSGTHIAELNPGGIPIPTSRRIGALGTSRLIREWDPHSTLLTPVIVMCYRIVARGFISRAKAPCGFWLRVTSVCSISTSPSW
jgi:PBP superfamily domain